MGLCAAVFLYFQGFLEMFGKQRDISSLVAIVRSWPENHYDHGYFILPAVAFLMWRNWQDVKKATIKPSGAGLFWVVAALAIFLLGIQSKHYRLTIMSIPPLFYGTIIYLWGKEVARNFIFPLLLFYFAVPVPGLIQATNGLQLIVTKAAVWMGQLCGMDVSRAGNQIEMVGAGGFNVDEGCSGIRSVVALTLVAFVYGYFTHKEWWKRLTIFALAVPVAMVANAARIFSILLVAKISPSFAKGDYHDYSGFVTFGVAVVVLMLISYVLNNGLKWKRAKTVVRRSTPGVQGGDTVKS